MKTQTFEVNGMHCASCSSIIQKTLRKVDGVNKLDVNYATEKVKIDFDPSIVSPRKMSDVIAPLGYSLVIPPEENALPSDNNSHMSQSKKDKKSHIADLRDKVLISVPLALFSVFVMGWDVLASMHIVPEQSKVTMEFFHHLLPLFATYMLFVVGKPYLKGLYRFLRYGKANMDTLIGIGTSVAFLYSFVVTAFEEVVKQYITIGSTYYDVTIIVITFITLGKYLEIKAKEKTADAISKLLNLRAKTALVVRNGAEKEVAIGELVHGDMIVVKPGSCIPVDGIVVEGASYVDESLVTGESMPVEKKKEDTVVAGTINTTGHFIFKATKIGSETLLSQIIRMVEEAQGTRAPIQSLADSISSVFVPVVLVLAFVTLGTWLLVGTSFLGFSTALSYGLTSFVGVLVIACPCALGLATPTAIIVGVGKGATEGILIKDASALETLHKASVIVVDKTGTITRGKPELVHIENMSDMSDKKLLSIVFSLESKSEHPIAYAISHYAKERKIETTHVEGFEVIKGKGLKGTVADIRYFVGNSLLIKDLKLQFDSKKINAHTLLGKTPIIIANQKKVLGYILVADTIKPEAKKAVYDLNKLGIKVVMLTGDNNNTAQFIAHEAGIKEVVANALPSDKLKKVRELQSMGAVVAMAGDGINDAPALAQADVGIAMGTGTDVAIETAGITLLHGDISKVVKAVHLSKLTMRGIKQNLFWAFIYNIVGIPLAAGLFYPLFGWLLNPVFAGFAMAFSSVSVVANSLRLKTINL
ncbi:MAG: heavy metal translocating P-type ATPase [Candidatus Roizmanbacteria bacterium]|nr:heavy metal translocating P-type ATPase [Candidatus Roizmanbacteria bacterium]